MEREEAAEERARLDDEVDRLVHASESGGAPDVPEMHEDDVAEITRLTDALALLRETERGLTESSRTAMGLTELEMRALRFLVVAQRSGTIATPSMLAEHLGISAASTTKLLNRLERGERVARGIHPDDRRAIRLEVDPMTTALVQRSVARQQARRFAAAARLTDHERVVVTRFLQDLTEEMSADRAEWVAEA